MGGGGSWSLSKGLRPLSGGSLSGGSLGDPVQGGLCPVDLCQGEVSVWGLCLGESLLGRPPVQ